MTESNGATETSDTTNKTTGSKNGGTSFDVAALRAALATAAGVPKISRPALAKLVGAHVNTVALWESGAKVGESYLAKLRELDARIAKGEKIEVPGKKKGGRTKRAAGATEATPRPKAAKKSSAKKPGRREKTASAANKGAPRTKSEKAPSFDVKALRAKLGASRAAFAKRAEVADRHGEAGDHDDGGRPPPGRSSTGSPAGRSAKGTSRASVPSRRRPPRVT